MLAGNTPKTYNPHTAPSSVIVHDLAGTPKIQQLIGNLSGDISYLQVWLAGVDAVNDSRFIREAAWARHFISVLQQVRMDMDEQFSRLQVAKQQQLSNRLGLSDIRPEQPTTSKIVNAPCQPLLASSDNTPFKASDDGQSKAWIPIKHDAVQGSSIEEIEQKECMDRLYAARRTRAAEMKTATDKEGANSDAASQMEIQETGIEHGAAGMTAEEVSS